MGEKSRGNWNIRCCLKDCINKDKCESCVRWDQYEPEERNEDRKNKTQG